MKLFRVKLFGVKLFEVKLFQVKPPRVKLLGTWLAWGLMLKDSRQPHQRRALQRRLRQVPLRRRLPRLQLECRLAWAVQRHRRFLDCVQPLPARQQNWRRDWSKQHLNRLNHLPSQDSLRQN